MKKSNLYFLVTFILFSCTTDSKADFEENSGDKILGTWIWQSTNGGLIGDDFSTPTSTGIQKILVFTDEGQVITYSNSVVTAEATYKIKKGISIFDGKMHDLLIFDDLAYVIQKIDSHNLTVDTNFPDGYSSTFKR